MFNDRRGLYQRKEIIEPELNAENVLEELLALMEVKRAEAPDGFVVYYWELGVPFGLSR